MAMLGGRDTGVNLSQIALNRISVAHGRTLGLRNGGYRLRMMGIFRDEEYA